LGLVSIFANELIKEAIHFTLNTYAMYIAQYAHLAAQVIMAYQWTHLISDKDNKMESI
jgi:hypothetical protein